MSTNLHNDDKRLLELLERWQSGDFSRADEQELNALAESDEFRRETVEGFWALPETDHAAHLASLRARLRKQPGGARRVTFFPIITAAAAVALLLLAVVWLTPNSEKSTPITSEAAPAPSANQPIASNTPENKVNDAEKPRDESAKLDRMPKTAPASPPSPLMDASPAPSKAASEIANAAPPQPSREEAAQDKLAKQAPVSEGEYAKVADDQDEVDQKPGNAAAEARAKKESAGQAKTKDAQKRKAPASANSSQPAGGWANFQDYLRQKARLPETARQNNISGSVRLKFRLDENNLPVDFQTLRSLGYGCDEEAIRLIKAYAWQRGNDSTLTLDVPFVR